jgi:hypothetical protein
MKVLALLLGLLVFAFLLPSVTTTPQAYVSGPEACALCGEFPLYCSQCWLWLSLISLSPEEWEGFYE